MRVAHLAKRSSAEAAKENRLGTPRGFAVAMRPSARLSPASDSKNLIRTLGLDSYIYKKELHHHKL